MNTLTPIKLTRKGKPFRRYIPDSNKFHRAFAMFMGGRTNQDICRELDVREHDLKHWIRSNDWTRQRNALINEAAVDVQQQLKDLITANILQVAERQLMTAEKLDGHIQLHLDMKSVGTKALADLSRAAVSSAKIASDIVGLGRATEEASKKPSSIQYNLMVIVAPKPAALPEPAEAAVEYF